MEGSLIYTHDHNVVMREIHSEEEAMNELLAGNSICIADKHGNYRFPMLAKMGGCFVHTWGGPD